MIIHYNKSLKFKDLKSDYNITNGSVKLKSTGSLKFKKHLMNKIKTANDPLDI